MLEFQTNSVKNIIMPKQLRETLVPPLDKIMSIVVNTNSRSTNIVDFADSMLWVSPRVKHLVCRSGFSAFVLQLTHKELLPGIPDDLCRFCTSHPSRCWRHSVMTYTLNHSCDETKKKVQSYIRANLRKAGRNDVD
ncbi:hypothetical protein L1987_51991 [Smallanthus sonchifolius]|uniref:Uncharacterized protein n=1 Tax=Smallanthus sonchifolius TaxID=185202 RepID=A0ACB9ESA1_9ASTR|nr:hypothetical protein L1987_51991 [Smallanthus sonchifolius]